MTAVAMPQCMDALKVANAVRSSNSQLRREIAAMSYGDGCRKVSSILRAPVGPVASIPVGRLLQCINGVGEERMGQLLRYAAVLSATRRVGALSPRQRMVLTRALDDRTLLWPFTRSAA